MKKSEKAAELGVFPPMNQSGKSPQHLSTAVTSNRVVGPTTCVDADYDQRLSRGGPENPEPFRKPVDVEHEFSFQPERDEEDLELPLPLRPDDGWEYSPFLLPHLHTHTHSGNLHSGLEYSFDCRYQPQLCHHSTPCQCDQPWAQSPNRFRHHDEGSVSVNVPHFSIPAVEDVSEVSVRNLSTARAESASHEKWRSINMPEENRNLFITYSSDAASEIVHFIDFLTKHGFRPAVDIFDKDVKSLGLKQWADRHLNDRSMLIIVAISPKYRADVDGFARDSHGLHTNYIHSMMRNEYIRQGSLNFRFIPVLFLNASQEIHVPYWLQDTCVYRWPQDTERLLLRLLTEERYVPPIHLSELTLVHKPVAPF